MALNFTPLGFEIPLYARCSIARARLNFTPLGFEMQIQKILSE
ncbi:hypothetical protein CAMRE0001_0589 [Campylobacter rectus RM3267]|uniref:Uncharacterized protein n=1 Tax=Campylobacter rectus RM3267 TaxID=553218 RepID=B9D5R5_CAMRE|nr:hypothetical protein CAMRE0001_0589 [Campylobacter rectus RM3267]